jgi:t-SNARE complex subunit (syntaxin)
MRQEHKVHTFACQSIANTHGNITHIVCAKDTYISFVISVLATRKGIIIIIIIIVIIIIIIIIIIIMHVSDVLSTSCGTEELNWV